MAEDQPDEVPQDPEFEDLVAALLKVDPEGITGQRAAKATKPADDQDE